MLVVDADNVVSQKVVKTGQKQGQLVIIESGLDPGDWVVIDGIQQAIPGAKVEPQRSELNSAEAGSSDGAKPSDVKPSEAKPNSAQPNGPNPTPK